MTIFAYFSRLKKIWDELSYISYTSLCTCGASKDAADSKLTDQLMEFLVGLNEEYDHVRSQILMMDPLPNVSNAYSMILRIEKQREINSGNANIIPNMAVQVFKKPDTQRNFQKKKTFIDKEIKSVNIVVI
ncbi:UNVERIFIED_CONTAM: hypothetical protein Sindi_0055700 [Sesamum indicum]